MAALLLLNTCAGVTGGAQGVDDWVGGDVLPWSSASFARAPCSTTSHLEMYVPLQQVTCLACGTAALA